MNNTKYLHFFNKCIYIFRVLCGFKCYKLQVSATVLVAVHIFLRGI